MYASSICQYGIGHVVSGHAHDRPTQVEERIADGLHRAQFVVDEHHRDERRRKIAGGIERASQGIDGHDAGISHRQQRHGPTQAAQQLHGVQHSLVLDRAW